MARTSKTPAAAPAHAQTAVNLDKAEFIRTRDALTSAYMHLSLSMDRMVKAYLDHTQTVLDGATDHSLNVSYLLAPLNGVAATIQALLPGVDGDSKTSASAAGVSASTDPGATKSKNTSTSAGALAPKDEDETSGGKKSKRQRRAERDPNAPKRPLTAYFRYLQEQRSPIAAEMAANPENFPDVSVPGKPGDISKIATDRWNQLSVEKREPYHEAYREAMLEYGEAVKAYRAENGIAAAAANGVSKGRVEDEEEVEEHAIPAGKTSRLPEDVSTDSSDSSDDDDEDDSSDDENEKQKAAKQKSKTKKQPTAAAAAAPASTTKRASAKKTTAAPAKTPSAGSQPSKPMFSSIPPPSSEPTASASKKRKAPSAAAAAAPSSTAPAAAGAGAGAGAGAEAEEPPKKKRGRKPKSDAVADDEPATPAANASKGAEADTPATAKTAAAGEKSAKKKKEKKASSKGAVA